MQAPKNPLKHGSEIVTILALGNVGLNMHRLKKSGRRSSIVSYFKKVASYFGLQSSINEEVASGDKLQLCSS